MFRIDDDDVVDATMNGNAARFINHSCDVSTSMLLLNTYQASQNIAIVINGTLKLLKSSEDTQKYLSDLTS